MAQSNGCAIKMETDEYALELLTSNGRTRSNAVAIYQRLISAKTKERLLAEVPSDLDMVE